jgi:hypothetical protein
MDSKMAIYELMPVGSYPRCALIDPKQNLNAKEVEQEMVLLDLNYPIILKPDIGFKGLGVALVKNKAELEIEISRQKWPYLIQEYFPYDKEIGIFYVKLPGQEKARITGMVQKYFLSLTGDGKSTIGDLIDANPRSRMQYKSLLKEWGAASFKEVLLEGVEKVLVPFGSHSRGAMFLDASALVDEALVERIQKISDQVEGFFYGRLDILYRDWESFSQGENFTIVEINGAGSEPTHIFDPRHSLWFAWKETIYHGRMMYTIARQNKKLGHSYMSHKDGRAMMKQHRALEQYLETFKN